MMGLAWTPGPPVGPVILAPEEEVVVVALGWL